jgi:hypothetical protein
MRASSRTSGPAKKEPPILYKASTWSSVVLRASAARGVRRASMSVWAPPWQADGTE